MNNRQVAHIWAQQTEQNVSGSNFFAEGPKLYSYGHHYLLGNFIRRGVVLINSRRYSMTTAKHTSYAVDAVSHFDYFRVPNTDPQSIKDHRSNHTYLVGLALAEEIRLAKARVCTNLDRLTYLIQKANDYNAIFRLKRKPLTVNSDILCIREKHAKRIMAEKKAKALKHKREVAKLKKLLSGWILGEGPAHNASLNKIDGTSYLRVKDPSTAITNRGAKVPLEHCIKAWPMILKILENGQPWKANGHTIKVGYFQVDSISNNILKAGCHTFKASELKRFAKVIGL